MINVLGLCLLATSLVTASIFSPNPTQQHKQAANTIVKEGHRVIVVEYDQDGYQNTKISISPEQPHHEEDFTKIDSNNIIDNAKDKIKEASSVLPNMGQGISQDPSQHFLHTPNPKELICDAYGKCKHGISNAMGKTKEKTQDAVNKKREEAKEVSETVSDAVNKAKETVYDKVHDVNEYTKESMEKGKDTGQTVKEHVVRNVSDVKERMRGAVSKISWCMESVESLMGVANLLGFASAYGMCVWITFVSSYVLSRAMPRQQFAVVQSKIYPVYFRAMAYCLGVALLGHVLGHGRKSRGAEFLQTWNLLASLLAVFVNSVYLEPRATKVRIYCFNFL